MEECKFCQGKPVGAEYIEKRYFDTMTMMLSRLTGKLDLYEEDRCCNGIMLANGNHLTFDNSACEYSVLGIEIKFCPFCGKALEGVKSDDDGGST